MEVNTVAIVGGGRVGSGIAIVTAKAGLKTILTEKTRELADAAIERITREIDMQIARWGMTESEKKFILGNLDVGDDLERSRQAQLALCSIPSLLEEQKQIFRQLNAICGADTIFTSNSSVLSITELGAELDHPENMLGLHFLHPVLKTKLVEIVRGFATSDQTYETGKAFVKTLGKKGIEVFESPGFITTRVMFPLINEAMNALMEGIASAEDIDSAIQLGYNMQMGPLELADRIGLDRVLVAMEHLFREFGEQKFRPCPLIKKLVRAKHFGAKTGTGFFSYDKETGKKLSSSFQR
ncbi:3-hydroxyacyl-CoA dehydrogenase NAD-binding [Candidatus Vecturithrix granuli]|uniref:3-hydroxyacyl-CoA dehydrogenase NAD-binding n=1 Tax=Vecturithrix granuli TaxID=1499967 RepID=A0A081C6S0_VECG1|nr:3-hydroxyacyl-CoA dehydrogenase NAD-binding [Candidatus Vecturithrix granuli]